MSESPAVLVVDDDRNLARTLADIIRIKGYQADVASDATEAIAKATKRGYDCVISDIKMPGLDGVSLVQSLRAERPGLPIVLMTAYTSAPRVREGIDSGAVGVLTKPLDLDKLLRFVCHIGRERSVLIVDDDAEFAGVLAQLLERRGFNVTAICDPELALERMPSEPSILVIDMKMDTLDGLEFLTALRRQGIGHSAILTTGFPEEMAASVRAALGLGAIACLHKPFSIDELVSELDKARLVELGAVFATR